MSVTVLQALTLSLDERSCSTDIGTHMHLHLCSVSIQSNLQHLEESSGFVAPSRLLERPMNKEPVPQNSVTNRESL